MHSRGNLFAVPIFQFTAFLGSFLLFTMEPFAGRILTPYFGGAACVWLICLTFFQLMLLAGYGYVHWLVSRLRYWHMILLISPLFLNPPFLIPTEITMQPGFASIAAFALKHFALLFLCLSSTSIILQRWLAQSVESNNPYRLYSVSNIGAIIALIIYPFLIEPLWGLKQQGVGLTIAYALYVILMGLCFRFTRGAANQSLAQSNVLTHHANHGYGPQSKLWKQFRSKLRGIMPSAVRDCSTYKFQYTLFLKFESHNKPSGKCFIGWTFLSALTSAVLVAVSGVIASDIGSFPLIWIMPLITYLLSFIAAFRDQSRMIQLIRKIWPEIILLGVFFFMIPAKHYFFYIGHCFICFALCLLVHNVLYRDRPHKDYLSLFYMAIALGGLMGSMLVSLITPLILNHLWEYPALLLILSIIFYQRYGLSGGQPSQWRFSKIRLAPVIALCCLIILIIKYASLGTTLDVRRNYYGVNRVIDAPVSYNNHTIVRSLVNGSTIHGIQFLDQDKKNIPTLYYNRDSGLADACAALPTPARIAAIGLGIGTIGAYTRPGDVLDFYEINPDMEKLARRWFTFLDNTKARTQIINGDGRLSLQNKSTQVLYDLIFIDAFSGEGIPTHLLTKEAMAVYSDHLSKNGVILFHVTNRFYDLRPVIKSTAKELRLFGAMKNSVSPRAESFNLVHTDYVSLAKRPECLQAFRSLNWIPLGDGDGLEECRPWTDDYVNILVPLGGHRGGR